MTTLSPAIPKHSRAKSWLVAAPLAASLLSGCSTLGKYRNDPGDVCYTQREQLTSSEHYYTKSVMEGALVGAATGAALGALTGWATGQNVGTAAAIGAGSGALVGGIGGYYMAKQKVAADAATLAGSIQNDIIRENGEIDKASIAFARLRDCRFQAADRVRADYQAQRITREDAQKKLDGLKSKFMDDIAIAETLGTKMGENMKQFQNASDQMLSQDAEAQMLLAEQTRAAELPPPVEKKTYRKGRRAKEAVVAQAAETPVCGKKKKRGCQPAAVAAAPRPAPSTATAARVEVAKVTESGQVKQKAFNDQISSAKAQAPKAFALSLEGNVRLDVPERLYCGL